MLISSNSAWYLAGMRTEMNPSTAVSEIIFENPVMKKVIEKKYKFQESLCIHIEYMESLQMKKKNVISD